MKSRVLFPKVWLCDSAWGPHQEVKFHNYTDDTQLYITVSPDDIEPINALLNCNLDIKSWMAEDCLQLKQDKTEVLIIGPEDWSFCAIQLDIVYNEGNIHQPTARLLHSRKKAKSFIWKLGQYTSRQ